MKTEIKFSSTSEQASKQKTETAAQSKPYILFSTWEAHKARCSSTGIKIKWFCMLHIHLHSLFFSLNPICLFLAKTLFLTDLVVSLKDHNKVQQPGNLNFSQLAKGGLMLGF